MKPRPQPPSKLSLPQLRSYDHHRQFLNWKAQGEKNAAHHVPACLLHHSLPAAEQTNASRYTGKTQETQMLLCPLLRLAKPLHIRKKWDIAKQCWMPTALPQKKIVLWLALCTCTPANATSGIGKLCTNSAPQHVKSQTKPCTQTRRART